MSLFTARQRLAELGTYVEHRSEIAARADAEPLFPGVRAGAHHGPVLERGRDYFGAVVNLASRGRGVRGPANC